MLAIIPARGESKGVPRKNIRLLNGRPLIAYTIQAALKSPSLTKVIVSTDCEETAQIAENYGADVPFLRPAGLAGDQSLAVDTYLYTCDRLEGDGYSKIENITVLQPTSPLRTSDDIENAVALFKAKKADSVISVCESTHPVEWYKKIDSHGVLRDYYDHQVDPLLNRQALCQAYVPNGAIFIFRYDFLKTHKTYYSDRTFPYIMPKERSIDIDTLRDFLWAEFLIQQQVCHEA